MRIWVGLLGEAFSMKISTATSTKTSTKRFEILWMQNRAWRVSAQKEKVRPIARGTMG